MRRPHHQTGGLASAAAILPIVCSILAGALVLGWQCLRWLQLAVWEKVTLDNVLNWYPSTGWLGVDRVLGWFVHEMPLALLLMIVLPLAWFFLWSAIFDRAGPPRRR
jgi:hypothetical protein